MNSTSSCTSAVEPAAAFPQTGQSNNAGTTTKKIRQQKNKQKSCKIFWYTAVTSNMLQGKRRNTRERTEGFALLPLVARTPTNRTTKNGAEAGPHSLNIGAGARYS